MNVRLTEKQNEYLNNAVHRWNIKSGATRSGKTYMDYIVIPRRLIRVKGLAGLNVIIGNTKGTLQRNIIEPLQNLYGTDLVGNIRADNIATMFGQTVYCLGADKVNQVNRLRGASIKYCYGDEVATWHEEVFDMLKSRLDKPYSCFDGTCNPEGPTHWFKKFLDSDADIYQQSYTLYDNPFVDKSFVHALEVEYNGTVYFDRYILGRWVSAEGAIYKRFADDPNQYEITRDQLPLLTDINIGVDFGGGGSNHAFVCTGIDVHDNLYALKADSIGARGTDVNDLLRNLDTFVETCRGLYGRIDGIYCDCAEQTIINTIRQRFNRYSVYNSIKRHINDRIRAEIILIGTGRFKYVKNECDALVKGLREAVYNSKITDHDERLDNGTSDIDVLDAFEYSWEKFMMRLTK